jgi:transposase
MKKGHKNFACVLVDLEAGNVIDVLKERNKEYLETYFKKLGTKFCKQIEVLSCDMWTGFANLVGSVFPNAQLVIDRFHFSKSLNKTLDSFRKNLKRTLFKDTELHQGKLRFALLKPLYKISNQDYDILNAAFEVSMDLKIFYNLKEEFRNIFNLKISRKEAINRIKKWEQQAENFNNQYLNAFLKTLNNWYEGILNYFNDRISNGIVEGKNNKVKMIKRRAFGFLNFENMRLRIIDEC